MRTFTAYMPEKNLSQKIGEKIYVCRRDGNATIIHRGKYIGYVAQENTCAPLCHNTEYLTQADYYTMPSETVATVVGDDFTKPNENGKKYRILIIRFDYMQKGYRNVVFEAIARDVKYIPKKLRTAVIDKLTLRYTSNKTIVVEFRGEIIGWLKSSQTDMNAYQILKMHLMNGKEFVAELTNDSISFQEFNHKSFRINVYFSV